MTAQQGAATVRPDTRQPTAPRRSTATRRRLGAGRSGEVWLVERAGDRRAVKVFFGDTLTNLVHYIVSGAPNPYIWNEDAIRTAYERRRILRAVAALWFPRRLHVSNALDAGWNEEARAWELETEFVEGTPVPLLHPLRPRNPQLDDLRALMQALQGHLRDAGFDGAVWQAGLGNPVALNNFLCLDTGDHPPFGFIDLESGVPALFPLQPLELLRFYLPRSFRHGRALFDDVDVPRLRTYIERHRADLEAMLGAGEWHELQERVGRLERHQDRWRRVGRTDAAIAYQLAKGRISDREARYYRDHRLWWWLRESRRALRKAVALAGGAASAIGRWLRAIDVRALGRNAWQFVSSQAFRTDIARTYVLGRIEAWTSRGQMTDADARRLLEELEENESSNYLTDFGAHLGMKAAFQTLELTLLAALAAAGVVSVLLVGVIVALDGLIYRSTYTLYRTAQAAAARQPLPWVALLVGLVPLLGSLAYPAQMAHAARERRECLARFLIYDTFTRLGTRLPIWGGKDTLVEHWFNRLAHRLLVRRGHGPPDSEDTAHTR